MSEPENANPEEANPEAASPEELSPDQAGLMSLFLRLRAFGIQDDSLFQALEAVPRDVFVPPRWRERAWRDECFPIACGQTLWSPDMVARIVHAAEIKKNDTVLELGTGSGYMTAILGVLARKVRSLERYEKLHLQAKERLERLGANNIVLERACGYEGTPGQGLYDCILCDSCYETVPEFLFEQMVTGGAVIAAIGEEGKPQTLVKLRRAGSRLEREDLFEVRFTMMENERAQNERAENGRAESGEA